MVKLIVNAYHMPGISAREAGKPAGGHTSRPKAWLVPASIALRHCPQGPTGALALNALAESKDPYSRPCRCLGSDAACGRQGGNGFFALLRMTDSIRFRMLRALTERPPEAPWRPPTP